MEVLAVAREELIEALPRGLPRVARHRAPDELARAVTNHLPVRGDGVRRVAGVAERGVERVGDVFEAVYQRAVEIEEDGVTHGPVALAKELRPHTRGAQRM